MANLITTDDLKSCKDCGRLPPGERLNRRGVCRKCWAARCRAWTAANPQEARAIAKRSREKQRLPILSRRYGVSVQLLIDLIALQDGRCAMLDCRRPLTKMHVDHDHNTGEVRGLLCPKCNQHLGFHESTYNRKEAFESYLSATPIAGLKRH
jgi:hypothetical protein